jgi:hypothetical protein
MSYKLGEPYGPRSRASHRARILGLGLTASITFAALTGCSNKVNTADEDVCPVGWKLQADGCHDDKGNVWVHGGYRHEGQTFIGWHLKSYAAFHGPECDPPHKCDDHGFLIASPAAKRKVATSCPDANPLYVERYGHCPKA